MTDNTWICQSGRGNDRTHSLYQDAGSYGRLSLRDSVRSIVNCCYLMIVYSLVYRDVAKWTVIEATLGIVAGCLPTIWPLLTAMRSRCVSSKLHYVNDKPLQHGGRVERGMEQDTIQNNHDTTQNNRDTILIHTDFFLSESFVNNSDNHVRNDPNNSFRHDQWRP